MATESFTPRFHRRLLGPRYWPTWLGIGLLWLICQLPYAWLLALGRGLGRLALPLAGKRRRIAARNLALCFPEKTAAERQRLLRAHFESSGIAVFETGIAWWWPRWRLQRLFTVSGLEHFDDRGDQGVLLVAFHFTQMELAAMGLGLYRPIDGMYRQHKNPVFEWVQWRGRTRFDQGGDQRVAIPHESLKLLLSRLRAGKVVWYAPDQDLGRKGAAFVDFFGIPAATLTLASKYLARTGARLVVYSWYRKPGGGYHLELLPPLSDLPSADPAADARRLNAVLEDLIRAHPEQYLWTHRRFKTRPPGAPSLYL